MLVSKMAEDENVVYRSNLYKSTAVADTNSHKLYWIDVIEKNGIYTAVSNAQLFRRVGDKIIPGSIRTYVLSKSKFKGECVKTSENMIRTKELRRGYRMFQLRKESSLSKSQIINFLLKYGK